MINLFKELEGKKGEVMAVAALRYLLMRNRPLREHFFRAMGESVSYSLFDDVEYFGCMLEVACNSKDESNDKKGGPPRIDMIVESNSAIIGIEAKLNKRGR